MATYTIMQTRILQELQRSDLNTAVSPLTESPIQLAIKDAVNHYQRTRFWFNETSATQSTVAGTATYAWPSDFVKLDSLVITANGTTFPLRQIAPLEIDELANNTSYTAVPQVFATYKAQFRLWPTPNDVYTLTQYYLKSYTALSSGSDTNNWTTEAEELIRTRAKKTLAAQWLMDMQMAQVLDGHEQDVLAGLLRQSVGSTATGRTRSWAV